jgi:hypothetical protein
MPPYLAGRKREYEEFDRLLQQDVILENLVLTGLRGVGKTVLLETFKPRAMDAGWLWVGADLSESASVSETSLAQRLLADLSVITSTAIQVPAATRPAGFTAPGNTNLVPLTYSLLTQLADSTPGLVSDKLKAVLEAVAGALKPQGRDRVIFAYDEAQNLSDQVVKDQYPLSVLLDVFQSIQKKGIPFMLVLTGLPTLFPKLVEARTFSERMFRVVTLGRLDHGESREAIVKPLDTEVCPVRFTETAIDTVCRESGGYPYFIQFICREAFDVIIQQAVPQETRSGEATFVVPIDAIQRKLDTDFFAGRWARVTDRQRELLLAIAMTSHDDGEFTIQDIVSSSKECLDKPFSPSHANQILVALTAQGLIYKNRFGKYSWAVPLLGRFILRIHSVTLPIDA